jgi:hypothetical protein
MLQLIMEADVEGLIGAGRHERSGDGTTWRNGYRARALDTRLGTLNLRVPKIRQDSSIPCVLEARKTSEQALVAIIQEVWIGGCLDPARRRSGAGHVAEWHLQEHRVQALQGYRRACRRVSEPPAHRANGPMSGSTPHTSRSAKAVASCPSRPSKEPVGGREFR